MASETRRAARAFVEQRVERFESRHPLAESQARLAAALRRAEIGGSVVFSPKWITEGSAVVLEADFAPAPGAQRLLARASLALSLLIAACIWALLSPGAGKSLAWLVTLFTGFAILAMPLVFVALGSTRLAEETRIRRAIQAALQDADPSLPPQQHWKDED